MVRSYNTTTVRESVDATCFSSDGRIGTYRRKNAASSRWSEPVEPTAVYRFVARAGTYPLPSPAQAPTRDTE